MKECQLCKNCFADTVETCPNDGMPTVHTIGGEPVLEGKYQLECRLGQGGMGVVYKARHAYLKTQLAIKVILPDLVGNDPQLVTRFRQEALAAAAIRHQNVVSVTDYGVIDGSVPFLVMEYVEGESLHDLLAREKSLSPERAFDLMAAVCAGVGAAHHQGIVHRDLKPLNIMICSDKPSMSQAVKILDFGLAKIKSGELLGSFIQAQTTGLMGSPYYMAPEQWADEEPDSRSDIYSLGVMLFQMLAGDVPFKGSSIPAIMKKHISDPAPTLSDVGVHVSPQLEAAVLHTLQKNKNLRTENVEQLVEELRQAIYPGSMAIHTTTSNALPVSSIKVTTRPAKSSVYVDNISVGQTRDDGMLLLDGIQSGNHRLRISHEGFHDWLADVVCDGKPQEIVAELKHGAFDSKIAIPRPDLSVSGTVNPAVVTQAGMPGDTDDMAQTVQHNYQPSRFGVSVNTIPPPKKSRLSPILFGIGGLLILFVIGIVGIGAAYILGVFGPGRVVGNSNVNTATPVPSPTGSPGVATQADMVQIPGGSFKMGRNDGPAYEFPEHSVDVKSFMMDKTEVTNAEYYQFVTESNYKPVSNLDYLAHWVNDAPKPSQINAPVVFVNSEDIDKFIEWRSKRDSVTYRLPTEEEWEYAARNGSDENTYPWGNTFKAECTAMYGKKAELADVGIKTCGVNKWRVADLLGNVWEWTATKASIYPGNTRASGVMSQNERVYIIRGGAVLSKFEGKDSVNSMTRTDIPASKRDGLLGFRLVTSN